MISNQSFVWKLWESIKNQNMVPTTLEQLCPKLRYLGKIPFKIL